MAGVASNPAPLSAPSHSADGLPILSSVSSQQEVIRGGAAADDFQTPPPTCSPHTNRSAPLTDKKIFMHYEPGITVDRSLERILRRLNANLVEFFNRDIDYMVTNRPNSRVLRWPSTTISPDMSGKASSSTSTSVLPGSNQAYSVSIPRTLLSTAKVNSPSFTRGRAMLMALSRKENTTPSGSTQKNGSTAEQRTPILDQLQASNSSSALIRSRLSFTPSKDKSADTLDPLPSNDLLTRARRLGIRILTFESVWKWVKDLPSDIQSFLQSAESAEISDPGLLDIPEDPERDRIQQVRNLTTPCIKIFDLKRQFRPLYMDRTDYLPNLWNLLNRRPRLNTITTTVPTTSSIILGNPLDSGTPQGSGSVPAASFGFITPHCRQQAPSHLLTPGGGTPPVTLSRQKHGTPSRHRKSVVKNATTTNLQRSKSMGTKGTGISDRSKAVIQDEPSGYCECCSLSFNNLFDHLQCTEHKQFANNAENYRLLDDILAKLPPLAKVLKPGHSKVSSHASRVKRKKKRHHSDQQSPTSDLHGVEMPNDRQGTPPVDKSLNENFAEFTNRGDPSGPPCLKLFNFPTNIQSEGVETIEKLLSFSDVDEEEEESVKRITNIAAICTVSPVSSPIPDVCVDLPIQTELELDPCPINESCPVEPIPDTHVAGDLATPFLESWRRLCSSVYVSEQFRSNATSDQPCSDDPPNVDVSPVLELAHARCSVCKRSHIPTNLSPTIDLQLHSLLGPGFDLHGIGCDVGSCGSSKSCKINEHSEESSAISPDIPQHSPTFDSHDHVSEIPSSIPTSPMCQRSADIADILSPASYISGSEIPVISTPCQSSRKQINSNSTLSSPDNLLLSRSPSTHSDITTRRKSTSWLFNGASFDAKLSDLSDDECESPNFINSSLVSIHRQKNLRKLKFCSETDVQTKLKRLPVIVDQKKRRLKKTYKKALSYSVDRQTEITNEHNSPPSYLNPIRSSRVAARVARESISLSVRALFSPSGMDRYGLHSNPQTTRLLSPSSLSTALRKSAVNSTEHSPQIKNRPHQSKRRLKRRSLFLESDDDNIRPARKSHCTQPISCAILDSSSGQ